MTIQSKHLKATTTPISEDRETIKEAIKDVNTAALIMSIVHMTGDTSVLKGSIKPKMTTVVKAGQEAQKGKTEYGEAGFTPQERETIRELALDAIEQYRDGGSVSDELSESTIDEMLHYMTGRELDDNFAAYLKEEIAMDGVDRRGLVLGSDEAREKAKQFPVIIIGAGMGGILSGIRLDEADVPFTIIEKNAGVGGTWYENRYPGCRIDVAAHSYSFSFEPKHNWGDHFPLGDDICDYYEHCADAYNLKQHIRFETEVVEARWDEVSQLWSVHVTDKHGNEEVLTGCAVISAVGQLNRPKIPEFKGSETFQGDAFHTAAWPEGCDLTGKRVAIIGSGATAFQVIPELAKTAGHLQVIQRSPAWMFPNPGYHSPVTDGQKWALEKLPYYSKWYRFFLFYTATEGVWDQTIIDENWDSKLSVSESNDRMRVELTEWIKSQVKDPELLEKVLPKYPPFGKRILQDNGNYLQSLQQDNVDLSTSGIREIVSDGIITEDGEHHVVDAIVYSTGFHADRFLFPMKLIGRNGIALNEQWGEDDGRAYLGITVPNFPNLYCIYGPNTNLLVAGSIAHNCESQVNYIMRSIKLMLENGYSSMDCKQDVHDSYNAEVDKINAASAWGSELVTNWYKNSAGRVTANLAFRVIDYWQMTKNPNPADYTLTSLTSQSTALAEETA